MTRDQFNKLVAEALDSLPAEFRSRIKNVAVLVEDRPAQEPPSEPGQPRRILLGLFRGTPQTHKSVFQIPAGPDHVVLYQKNIEAVCSNDDKEVREQIRRTVIHEFGHYFGMTEEQLRGV